MHRAARVIAALSIVWSVSPALFADPTASAVVPTPTRLTVRVYDMAGLPEEGRSRAIQHAQTILEEASLQVEWRDCRTSVACAGVLQPGELMIRFMNAGGAAKPDAPLGLSFVDNRTGTGTVASVFVDRVKALAWDGRIDRWPLTGRVIAHEIGHLLLGSNAHTATGLMRAVWTPDDLKRDRKGDWVFSAAQRRQLDGNLRGYPRVVE